MGMLTGGGVVMVHCGFELVAVWISRQLGMTTELSPRATFY